ncbi:MAG: dephospho-CoA kinase [Deltaproteobacteria bacterium]|nr:dephospho-CoA kinase [Deltaproteobacteria bacterium]
MKVVGLTGGIATGKSIVAKMLRIHHQVPVIDLDRVAREVVEPGKPALRAIVAHFGEEVLRVDGTLDRGALRHRIATDPDARRALESITHPAIREVAAKVLGELALTGVPAAVVEAALLVETGSWRRYPVLIVVTCDPETQLRRLVERDGQTEEEARALIAAQLPMAEKEAVATHVIRNEGDLQALEAEVDRVWGAIVS